MALTSRMFLEPALDGLWFAIDSFEPIIDCLPEDLWQEEPSHQWTMVSVKAQT